MSQARGRGRRRDGHEEEHENHERWLVTYADMLTVLMALFIVLFAMSQVDQTKFEKLRASLAMAFGQESVAFDAQGKALAGEAGGSDTSPADVTVGQPQDAKTKEAAKQAVAAAERARASAGQRDAKREVDEFDKIKKRLQASLARQDAANKVRFRIDERGLVVTVVTDSVVFANNQAVLLPAGQRIVDTIAPELRPLPNGVEVDGHTNRLPVVSGPYPSNWELSTARASTVVRRLAGDGIAARRLTATGYADQKPLHPYGDDQAMELNRRVEIVVKSRLPAETRTLLPSAAGQLPTG
ncbi:flagellar motor protein MotB [Actinomadura hibisca]|uniref:flagellar motor protein MotB n=1 Tax=Actinomadura hibisca TaxID=68565 RepID=UPI00083427A9|nr:flagellar motor protein MotB [Actinomadura hibisca]